MMLVYESLHAKSLSVVLAQIQCNMVFLVMGIYSISSLSTMPFQSSSLGDWCLFAKVARELCAR